MAYTDDKLQKYNNEELIMSSNNVVVATMNAEKGRLGTAFIANAKDFLQEHPLCVLALQEVSPEILQEICREQNWHMKFEKRCTFNGLYRGKQYHNFNQGIGTISTNPILHCDVYAYDEYMHPKLNDFVQTGKDDEDVGISSLLHTQIAFAKKKLDIFNTHGIWTAKGASTKRQAAGIKKMLKYLKKFKSGVVLGDFNITKYPPNKTGLHAAYVQITKAGLKDCLPENITTTLNAKHHRNGKKTDDVIVDYMFQLGNSKQIMNVQRIQIPSDHYGLRATIE